MLLRLHNRSGRAMLLETDEAYEARNMKIRLISSLHFLPETLPRFGATTFTLMRIFF